jgi:uncharacterized protein (TIGR02453 family)
MAFSGFPPEAIDFYRRLEADNTRDFWHANKPIYEQQVKAPLLAFCDSLPDDLRPFQVFRPNRDVRFAKDKSPYKTNIGAYCEHEGGSGYYVALSADGLMAGCGYYAMAADQLERFRAAVADDVTGPPLAALVAGLERRGFRASAIDELKTAPRGYPKDHPRIALIRRKGLIMMRSWEPAAWLHTKAAATKITDAWKAAVPVCAWLDRHVGPSELPPEDDRWVR